MPNSFKTFRDPLLSLYQSAVADVAKQIDGRASRTVGRRAFAQRSMTSILPELAAEIAEQEVNQSIDNTSATPVSGLAPRELSKAGIARVCADLALRYMKASALGDDQALAQIRNEFTAGTCDPAWITTLEAYRSYFGSDGQRKTVPYIRPAQVGPKIIEIKADARIALIGDWGTGTSPAMDVLQSVANEDPDLMIHLGDIYYSGTPEECRTNFLDPIDGILRKQKSVPVFSLSGNHDMYCGGVGYYNLLPKLNAAPFTQPASFFCLRSADEAWQLLAMDTGLHDDNPVTVGDALTYLEEDELNWHCDRIREFSGRTILLSHHQLFSAFSPIGPVARNGSRSAINPHLLAAFKRMSAVKDIAAWFWGHEHTLGIYQRFADLERGRCVGHSAVPVSVIDEIYKPVPGLESTPLLVEPCRLGTTAGVYNHGYVSLVFQGKECRVAYYQVTRTGRELVHSESFS